MLVEGRLRHPRSYDNRESRGEAPGISHIYDHPEGDTDWSQHLVYAVYADDPVYPLFRPSVQQDDYDQDHDVKYDLALEIVTELEDEVGVPLS